LDGGQRATKNRVIRTCDDGDRVGGGEEACSRETVRKVTFGDGSKVPQGRNAFAKSAVIGMQKGKKNHEEKKSMLKRPGIAVPKDTDNEQLRHRADKAKSCLS